MKRLLLIIVVLAVAGFAAYKIFGTKSSGTKREKPAPLTLGSHSGSFNESYGRMLTSYISLKDALVASDTVKANAAASMLAEASDSLKVDEIEGDSTGVIKETAKNFSGTIAGSALALAGEKKLDDKRKEFEMISDALWSLSRTVKYEGPKVYYQFCPMAFDNKGAYWISLESEIKNPYFGDKMLTCGSTQDSLDYNTN
jgi:Cu(I)/Ag(I) efflux system membrane fusion protein